MLNRMMRNLFSAFPIRYKPVCHTRRLQTWSFEFKKNDDFTILDTATKTVIADFLVTVQQTRVSLLLHIKFGFDWLSGFRDV